jgi:hypothetical protein
MKKVVVSVVLVALMLQGTASASVIKGSSKSCKVGTTRVDSKYKYTCIGSGIWKKVLIPVKKPEFVPQPIPVVPVTATEVLPHTETLDKVIDQKEKAFNAIKSNTNSVIKNISYSFFTGSNFPKDIDLRYRAISVKAFKYWDNFLPNNSKIHVYFISEKDKLDYSQIVSSRYNNSQWMIDQTMSFLNIYNNMSINYSTGGTATQLYEKDGSPVAVVNIWAKSTHTMADAHDDLPAHEITHAYQFLETLGIQKQNFTPDTIHPGNWIEGTINIPCNLWEGTASLFGAAIVSDTYSDYLKELSKLNKRVKNTPGVMKVLNQEDVAYQMNRSNSWLGPNCDIGYCMGAYTYEWMILNYGIDSYTTLFDNIRLESTFEKALQRTIRLSTAELYSNSKDYVFKEYSR